MRTRRILPAALFASVLAVPVALAQQTPAPATGTSQDSRTPPITGQGASGTTAPAATTPPPMKRDAPAASTARRDSRYMQLDGMDVANPAGEKIGEVSDVLIDRSGKVVALAVEAGGFLGLGDRHVVVQFDQVKLDGDRFVTTLTKEQLKDMPEWKD